MKDAPERAARVAGVALLVIAGLAAVAGHLHFVNMTWDDAFISFRYAQNLAHGNGLVFNPGERVEGYSNFLWTVLMAIPVWLGADRSPLGLLITAKATGLFLSLGTLFVVARLATQSNDPVAKPWGGIAALATVSAAPFCAWGVGAMETPLVTLLLAVTALAWIREESDDEKRPFPWSSVGLFLAAITRPEPVVLLLPLVALSALRNWRRGGHRAAFRRVLFQALVFAIPYAGFLLFRWTYYGDLLPNTYYAKLHADPRATVRGWAYLAYAFDTLDWAYVLIASLVPITLARRWSYRVVLLLTLICALFGIVVYEGGDWMPLLRLLVPAMPLIGMVVYEGWVAAGCVEVRHFRPGDVPSWVMPPHWLSAMRGAVDGLGAKPWAPRLQTGLRITLRTALAGAVLAGSIQSYRSVPISGLESGFRRIHLACFDAFEIGWWMRDNVEDKDALLAIGEAGVIPYYTGMPVLDLFGLMDPHIAHLPGVRHVKFDVDYVFSRKPRYVLLFIHRPPGKPYEVRYPYGRALVADPRFSLEYAPFHEFKGAILFERKRVESEE